MSLIIMQRLICQICYSLMLVGLIFSAGQTHLGLMLTTVSAQFYSVITISKKWIFCINSFVDFQTLSEEEVSNEALADAIIKEFEDEDSKTQNEYRMDVLWYHLQSIKSPIGNNKSFNFLFEIVQVVLLIPHSNATIDCFFLL